MFIGYTIGYVKTYEKKLKIKYLLDQCSLSPTKNMINPALGFCYIFNLNITTGVISLNRSTFTKFQNQVFTLNVTAQLKCPKFMTSIKPIVADNQRKAKFVFNSTYKACIKGNNFFASLKKYDLVCYLSFLSYLK